MPRTRSLDSYPRPGLTVDLAVLTVVDPDDAPRLCVLVQDRSDPVGRALPGAFVRERRTVAESTADVLERKIGISPDVGTTPRLLRLFDDPHRDDRTWAMSAGHALSIMVDELGGAVGDLVPVGTDGRLVDEGSLLFDHDQIVTAAVADLRQRYELRHVSRPIYADPDGFMPEPFTLHQLRKVHEAVLGSPLHKDNFNRRMKPLLDPVIIGDVPQLSRDLRGRPAALYVREHPAGVSFPA